MSRNLGSLVRFSFSRTAVVGRVVGSIGGEAWIVEALLAPLAAFSSLRGQILRILGFSSSQNAPGESPEAFTNLARKARNV